ncbi:MAG TPA: PASTA domain-containing protein, partial [Gaiellaceae bacterium]|nr:PASTA domain-containing protein [Gaiellaceae bacterium]
SLTAAKAGFDTGSASTIAVPDGGTATRNFTLSAAAQSGCFVDTSQSDFQQGTPNDCDLTTSAGDVVLASPDVLDQHADDNGFGSGYGFSNTSLAGQTFTAGMTGKLERAYAYIFCASCSGTNPDMTLELRKTSGGLPDMSAGGLLATSTIPGTSDGAGGMFEFSFAIQPAVTAGTQYGLVIRLAAGRTGTQAWLATSGDVMAGGRRVVCTTTACSTPNGQNSNSDLVFSEYVNPGYASAGTFVSSLKDSNPTPGSTAHWTTLSWTATTPTGTGVKFQVAASNSRYGPFTFVGPDGTAGTFFTSSGASLSRFDGMRYLEYKGFLSTNSSSLTPSLSSVSVCFSDTASASATTLSVDPATGAFGGTTSLSATLTNNGTPVANEPVTFKLNGASVGSAPTNASGVATLPGVSLSGITAGSYPTGVGVSFGGDTGLDASTGSGALTVSKADQAITVTTHAPSSAVFGSQFTVAATGGGSGNAVTFASGGGCSNSGATFTMTSGTTACQVKYDQAGNANYNAAPEVTESVTAQKASQAITVTTHAPGSAVFNTQFTVAANAPGGAVAFSSSGGCSNTAATFTMTSGTTACQVKYDQAGNANYNAAPEVTESVTAQKANQAITVMTHAPPSAVFNSQFTVAASAPGGTIAFSSSGGCSNTAATFTMTSGTTACQVKYDQAGNANYNAAPQVTESVTATKAAQAITVTTHAPASAVYNSQFTVAATGGGSANPVTFSSAGGCSNTAATFTMTSGTTTCQVKYDQAGDANYNAAPEVTESVTAQKANQAIAVTTHAPASAVFNTQFTVAATAGASGNPVTFSSAGGCSNTAGTFTMTSGTTACQVSYDEAGDANYSAASEIVESVTAQKADQTITVITDAPATAVYATSFSVAASAPGGLVTFSYGGVCLNFGDSFTMMSGSGTCTVKYDQIGNANYNAAPEVTETVNALKADQTITVTTHAPANAGDGSSFTVAATAPGGSVAYSSAGGCTNVLGTFTMTSGTGTCTVKYDQPGDADYNPAPQLTDSVTAGKVDQSISVTTHAPAGAVYESQFSVAASAPGGAVAYASAGSCSNNGATFTMTSGTGTCTVEYDQAGNGSYNPAPEVTESVTSVKAAQSISVATHAPAQAVFGSQFTVAASAPGGAVTYSSGGSCSNSGATFTMTSPSGACTVTYDQPGNSDYGAAPEVSESVSAVAAFGGFQAPLPNAALTTGAKITVEFTLTDASGHPLPAATAASLAAAGSVEVTLTGPNGGTTQLATAACTWAATGQFYQCSLKAPSGLKTGTTNPYSLTATQSVAGQFVPAPSYTDAPADANPETVFFTLPHCVVPNVKGKTLKAAGRTLKAHSCSLGTVTQAFSAKVKNRHVISTNPKPGKQLHQGAKVSLVVSKGRHP